MYPDADEKKIQEIIDAVPKPEIIAEIRFRLDYDWEGDPAVKGLILVRDSENDSAAFDRARPYRDSIEQSIRDARIGYYPFFNLTLESERRELDAETEREQARSERRKKKVVAVA